MYKPFAGCVVLCNHALEGVGWDSHTVCVSVCVLVWFGVITFCDCVCVSPGGGDLEVEAGSPHASPLWAGGRSQWF
jgi:hypothetical protein